VVGRHREDHLGRDVHVQFRPQRGRHLDLGEDTESLGGQSFSGGGQRLPERPVDDDGDPIGPAVISLVPVMPSPLLL
jgi:hypothetical protein